MDEKIIIIEDEVEVIDEIEIVESADGAVDSGTRHNTLIDKNDPGSHEICAINGLQAELDKIETPRVIESNMRQQADYYKWEDESKIPTYPIGRFVSLYTYNQVVDEETATRNGTGNICLCDGTNDVFGVTVEGAGFVGNQAYTVLENGTKIGRDGKYNLVAHSGVVAVQKQTDVVVGDYVVSDAFGMAKKSDGKYGYLVTGLSDLYGEQCAIISLYASSTIAKDISDTLYRKTDAVYDYEEGLVARMKKAEGNISHLTTSLQEFKTPDGDQLATKDDLDKVYDKVDGIDKTVNEAATNAQSAATQAGLAAKDAADIRSEAVGKANEAITAIEQIGESVKTLTYDIAEYSIGEYSQAYGLTYEQAKKAIEIDGKIGCVHIPTVDHEEMYEGYEIIHKDSSDAPSNIQKFSKRYYYTWNGEQWIPSDGGGVVFSLDEYFIGETTPYWVVEDDVTSEDGQVYHKGEVWYWNNGEPELVTTVDQNGFSRAVNYIHKAINETSLEVTNAKGDVAALQTKLDEEGARVGMVASVITDIEGKPEDTKYSTIEELEESVTKPVDGTYYCVGDAPPYKVYKAQSGEFIELTSVYYDGVNFCKVNTASIITAVNNDGNSKICLNADRLNFKGYSAFISTDDDGKITSIDGNIITTGIIQSADKNVKIDLSNGNVDITGRIVATSGEIGGCDITDGVLRVDSANIDGKITAEQIDATNLRVDSANIDGELVATKIEVDELSSITSNMGLLEAGVIQSKGYGGAIIWDDDSDDQVGSVILDSSSGAEDSVGLELYLSTKTNLGDYYSVEGIGDCTDSDVVIPATYDGIPVKYIKSKAFENNEQITSIIIPDTMVAIYEEAFLGCPNLTSVVIKGDSTVIHDWAFGNCGSLISVNMADGIKSIGHAAFINCTSLTNINLPFYLTSIKSLAFAGCTSLLNVMIPDSVTTIEYSAFSGCESLMGDLVIPDSVTSIGYEAFLDCKGLTSVTIGNGVSFIDNKAFGGCTNLTNVIIGDSVITIDMAAFGACTALKNIVIGGNVKQINKNAFYNCNSLTNVYYSGKETKWDTITFEDGNTYLTNATRYYYSATKPTTEGNYWYRKEGGLKISCDNATIDSKNFKINSNGTIVAKNITMEGAVVSGDWHLGKTRIYTSSEDSFVKSALYSNIVKGGSQICLTTDGVYIVERSSGGSIVESGTVHKTWAEICNCVDKVAALEERIAALETT